MRMKRTHCKNGHEHTPENTYVDPKGRRFCRTCKNAASRKWSAENRPKRRESNRSWEARNPERKRESFRRWRANNLARNRDRHREWVEGNRDRVQEVARRWHHANLDKRRANLRAMTRRRRARKVSQLGSWTISEAEFLGLLYETYPFCYYCQVPLDGTYHVEHKIPLSRPEECPQGRKLHEPWNIRLACPSCNLKKGSKTTGEFAA